MKILWFTDDVWKCIYEDFYKTPLEYDIFAK